MPSDERDPCQEAYERLHAQIDALVEELVDFGFDRGLVIEWIGEYGT